MSLNRSAIFLVVFAGISIFIGSDFLQAQRTDDPVAVVELFTSEGCSSCPPADRILRELVEMDGPERGRIFALGFHVDYWDDLGWPDRFSSSVFTRRQRQYAQSHGSSQIYTPQMIVNGRHEFVGARRDLAMRHIDEALAKPAEARLDLQIKAQTSSEITIGYTAHGHSPDDLLRIALVENNLRNEVTRGENRGRTLSHANVVRVFDSVSLSTGSGEFLIALPEDVDEDNAAVIAYIQDPKTFAIRTAARLDYKDGRF